MIERVHSYRVHQSALGVAMLLAIASVTLAEIDQIHLRDGKIIEGVVLNEVRSVYTVQSTEAARKQLQIPKHAVKFIVYGDRSKTDQYLGLSRIARSTKGAALGTATLLPTQAFAQAALEAVRGATNSIWMTAYYISGAKSGQIREIYDTLREKVKSGVSVVLVCEFSSGTRPAIRHATLNVASELAADKIEVLFIQEYRSMHKKMIIVDGNTVFLGSSNLTQAGTESSNEMNVQIATKAFARRAIEDFQRIRSRAKTIDQLKE